MWVDHQPWWGGWDSHSYCYREGLRASAGSGPGSGVTGQRIAREGQHSSPHYPMALLGTSLMQALKLLLAATVGLWPSTQHLTPFQVSMTLCTVHSATLQSWQGQEATPDPAAQWSPMSTHFSSPPGDFHVAWPHWDSSVQRMVIRKQRGVLPTLESPGWASTDPHTPVEGHPASSFVVCF